MMKDKLRKYLENLFEEAPKTRKTVELKEEMIQNLSDKYDDLLAEGKSEEAAYNIVIAGVGDIRELIAELQSAAERSEDLELISKSRRRSAAFTSIAVMLYILCIIPPMILENNIGAIAMFSMVAIATGLLVYNNMTKLRYRKAEDTVVEDFKEWNSANRSKKSAFHAISGALWSITIAAYFVISFLTMAWHITWIIFLIAAAVNSIIKAIFDLVK